MVKGIVTPDEFMVFKPTLKKGFASIISKQLGSKEKKLIYATEGTSPTKDVQVDTSDRQKFVLTDQQILRLSRWGMMIEDHYQKPMDIEWAYDTKEDQLYIVQARPETVQARKNMTILEDYILEEKGKVLTQVHQLGGRLDKEKLALLKIQADLVTFKKVRS